MSTQSSENRNTNAAPKFTEDDANKSRHHKMSHEPQKEPKKGNCVEELNKIREAKPLNISITKGIAGIKLGEKKVSAFFLQQTIDY